MDGLISRGVYNWNNVFIGKWMGLYPGGFISGIMYSLENGWAYIQGGLYLK